MTTTGQIIKSPFPWFGGKSRAAELIWPHLGDVPNYVEPFAGSLAVLLRRPTEPGNEIVNDLDCYVANAWRAVQQAPEQVAAHCDWPVNEADLHARHRWLHGRTEFRNRMEHEPDFYDARIAGYWIWGLSCWIGDNFCRPKPQSATPRLDATYALQNAPTQRQVPRTTGGQGVARKVPHLTGGKGGSPSGAAPYGRERRKPVRCRTLREGKLPRTNTNTKPSGLVCRSRCQIALHQDLLWRLVPRPHQSQHLRPGIDRNPTRPALRYRWPRRRLRRTLARRERSRPRMGHHQRHKPAPAHRTLRIRRRTHHARRMDHARMESHRRLRQSIRQPERLPRTHLVQPTLSQPRTRPFLMNICVSSVPICG